ncbi:HAD family hydrolase [Streptomyces sp. NPDC088387]|uniref:HAD family hydrolase n=1 Tax=Streptomyces sp. NPDC088387 TaxID=3365859 RepID=UPI0037F64D5F
MRMGTLERPRLVATDLDGTIVREDGTISARTVAAFTRVADRGSRFVLVTGRPPRLMGPVADAFAHHGVAICSNGALIYDLHRRTVRSEHAIAPAVVAEVARRLRAALPGLGLAVEHAHHLVADPSYEPGDWDRGAEIVRVPPQELPAGPAPKLIARHPLLGADELLARAAPLVDDLVTVYHSNGERLIEAVAPGVSKASALERLAAELGVSAADAIAFGDMPNDLPMLAWAGTSYAVANAHPRVLAQADHVIGSNEEDAVAGVLERLFAGAPAGSASAGAAAAASASVPAGAVPAGSGPAEAEAGAGAASVAAPAPAPAPAGVVPAAPPHASARADSPEEAQVSP